MVSSDDSLAKVKPQTRKQGRTVQRLNDLGEERGTRRPPAPSPGPQANRGIRSEEAVSFNDLQSRVS